MTNDWQTVELSKVMRLEIDAVPVNSQSEFQMAGVYSFARGLFKREALPNTQTTYKFFHRLHKDMFVISVPKGWEGALARVTENFNGMFLSPVFPTFRANPKELDIRYFEWYCRQSKVWDELRRKSRGIGARRESISAEKFLSLEIPLPPLDEQRRIVEYVETTSALVANALSLREEADLETEILAFATARKIFANLDAEIIELGELVDQTRNGIQTGPFGAQLGSGDFIESGHPVITIGNVQFTGLETRNKLKFISKAKAKQLARFAAQEGDILFARMGTVGRCCVVPKEAEGWIYNYHLIRVALDKTKAEPRYIHWLIRASEDIETKLGDKIRGATREGVNSKIVASLPCRVPPLDEQRRIVAYLDSVQARLASLRELQSATGEELSALLPSVLDRAFKGEM